MKKIVAIVGAALFLVTGCQWVPGSQASREKEVQKAVAWQLRDPSSAQFREVREVVLDNGAYAYCGSVNGKNSFGAYSGYRDFVVHKGKTVAIEPEPMTPGDLDSVARSLEFVALSLQICASRQANRAAP